MDELLDRAVPRFDDPADWNDVLARARRRRRPRARLLVIAAAALAVLVVAPALAVVLRDRSVHLPSGADRSNIVVVMQPRTGRILLEAAPWRGHDGFCYLVLQVRAGCVPHKSAGTALLTPPLFGWSFDPRIRTGTATTVGGKHVPLTVVRFGGKVDATFFLIRDRLPRLLREVVLRDAQGRVVARMRLSR
jgi:hypothetical protein